ncbi:MAG: hypothetical protein PWQ82_1620 [Thermosediminibacterales bacterium]|nr:hypothetical protein [Thermosediminibacterales bacterium]
MKILMLSWEYPPRVIGGLARHVYHVSREIARNGHEIHVITCIPENFEKELPQHSESVYIHWVHPYDIVTNDFKLWVLHLNMSMIEKAINLILQTGNFDIIHCHDWMTAYSGKALKHSFRIPLVATIHATEWGRNGGIYNQTQSYINSVEWWLNYEAWKVICCSKYMKNELQNLFSLPEDKIRIIPNGIEVNTLKDLDIKFKRSDYASDDEKIIFFIGRLVEEKGVQIALKAMPIVLAENPNVKFVISGDGPRSPALKKLASELGIAHKVIFTGYIDDKVRNSLFNASSAAIFPSLYEPFGIVALEAMAAGVPVIVSDTGGFKEIVDERENGLKVPPGNPEMLAKAINTILENQILAQKIKAKGLNMVKKRFSWENIAQKTVEVYSETLKEYEHSPWKPFMKFKSPTTVSTRS